MFFLPLVYLIQLVCLMQQNHLTYQNSKYKFYLKPMQQVALVLLM